MEGRREMEDEGGRKVGSQEKKMTGLSIVSELSVFLTSLVWRTKNYGLKTRIKM